MPSLSQMDVQKGFYSISSKVSNNEFTPIKHQNELHSSF